MTVPLEDNFADVIGKAQRGLHISDSELAAKSGVSSAALKALRAEKFDEAAARKIAPLLGLNASALVEMGLKHWKPRPVELDGLAAFHTPFDDITVNSYLAWDSKSKQAAAFDTGSDCSGMLAALEEHGLKLHLILLTHTHGDHVYDLDRLKEKTGAKAFVSEREPMGGADPFGAGKTFEAGNLRIETRLTWGHSRGGTTYVVKGLAKPVAVVGDALFASSMGGGMVSYADALRTNREQIFTLDDETIICPGHGPMTTVAEEKKHNPFFA
jgi:glyoxylase-like metal-dependent hydrolase (beta-lactamase superfamily II)